MSAGGRRLLAPGVASLLLYAWLALGFRAGGGGRDVALFLAAFAGLFALYAWAWRRLAPSRKAGSGKGRAPAGTRWPGPAAGAVPALLLFAAAFRLVMVLAGLPAERPLAALGRDLTGGGSGTGAGYDTFLLYDNDVWRYLWDGHVAASGLDPLTTTPRQLAEAAADAERAAPPLESQLWWDVLDNVSFQRHTTVYPPAAQALFRLAHALRPGSVAVWKLIVALLDLGTCLLLVRLLVRLRRPPAAALLYAWNPLVVKEFAGSGHVDALMVLLLTAALALLVAGRERAGYLALGLAILAKLAAAVLVPLFLLRSRPRSWWVLPATLAVGALPWLEGLGDLARGLAVYGRDWVFNPGPWLLLERALAAIGATASAVWASALTKGAAAALAVGLAWRWRRRPDAAGNHRGLIEAAFWTLAFLVLTHPAVMPWYVAWALPLAVLAGNRSWLLLSGLCLLSYLFYVDGVELAWWLWLEYGLYFAALAVEWRRGRRGAAATGVAASVS